MIDTGPNGNEPKMLTIPLTGRGPVRIVEAEWPVLARGCWDDCDGHLGQHSSRSWRLLIQVRCHADGRAIIYGAYDYEELIGREISFHATVGQLCDCGDDLLAAISAVACSLRKRILKGPGIYSARGPLHLMQVTMQVTDECIGNLPAEVL